MAVRFMWCAVAMVLAAGSEAFGQTTYVSASVFGDIVRSTHTEFPGVEAPSGGEAIGFAVRAGTPLGSVWGVDVEYARPGEIENDATPGALPLGQPVLTFTNLGQLPSVSPLIPEVFAPTILPYSIRTSARHTTLSTSVWVQQLLSARVAMVYLGGMAFHRSEHEYEYQIAFPRLLPPVPGGLPSLPVPASFRSGSVVYGVRPMAGVESRVGMGEHAHLSAGVRLQASGDVWLIRPSLGLGWEF